MNPMSFSGCVELCVLVVYRYTRDVKVELRSRM